MYTLRRVLRLSTFSFLILFIYQRFVCFVRNHLLTHSKYHTAQTFPCTHIDCNKVFRSIQLLNKHLEKHLGKVALLIITTYMLEKFVFECFSFGIMQNSRIFGQGSINPRYARGGDIRPALWCMTKKTLKDEDIQISPFWNHNIEHNIMI